MRAKTMYAQNPGPTKTCAQNHAGPKTCAWNHSLSKKGKHGSICALNRACIETCVHKTKKDAFSVKKALNT